MKGKKKKKNDPNKKKSFDKLVDFIYENNSIVENPNSSKIEKREATKKLYSTFTYLMKRYDQDTVFMLMDKVDKQMTRRTRNEANRRSKRNDNKDS